MSRKSIIIWSCVCAVLFIAGMIGSIASLRHSHSSTVRIISDGQIIRTIDLSSAEDCVFTVQSSFGTNVIEIKEHRIHVTQASCPDGVCVNTGFLKSGAIPVVCLPNHLVIEFTESSDIDAVSE